MRNIFANSALLVTSALAIAVFGFLYGYYHRDFLWFARSGSLVVSIGLALLSRASVIGIDTKIHISTTETGLSQLDPEHYRRLGISIPDWVQEDHRTRSAVGILGPIVSLFGTIIWGFGDLLNTYLLSKA